VAAEISAIVAEEGFDYLRSAIVRVARPDLPVPFSRPLEDSITPTAERVVEAIRGLSDGRPDGAAARLS